MTAVLQRKLAQAQSDQSTGDMTALRALRLSVARAGDALFGLPLAMLGGRQARAMADEIEESLSDQDLLMVLDCPRGMTGVASISLPLVSSVIQQQTMCQVSDRAPDERAYTETDAAMCAPLIEDILRRACETAEGEADQTCFRNLRFGARGEDVRTVVLGLQAKRYRVFWLTLDIALGRHQAQLGLVLPDAGEEKAIPETSAADQAPRKTAGPMLDVPVQMNAVLTRFQMSLSALNALKPGDTFPVSRSQLDETTLVSITGDVVARGRLGQFQGNRAVRVMPASRPLRVENPGTEGFEPQATLAPPPAESEPDTVLPEDTAYDTVLDADSLAALSPEEAADQITALAGLTEADLRASAEEPLGDDTLTAYPPALTDQSGM